MPTIPTGHHQDPDTTDASSSAGPSEREKSVKAALTPNSPPELDRQREPRRAREVENPAFTAFVRRIIRAHGRRIAAGDVEALRDLLALADDLDIATHTAVAGLRRAGYSWAEIAERTGTTRQAAHQHWGQPRSADQSAGIDTYASTDATGERA